MKTEPRNDDEQLDALLGRWRGIAPRPGFEDRVWQRIREGQDGGITYLSAWRKPWTMTVGTAIAASLGIVVGIGSAVANARMEEEPLLNGQTVAGSYVRLVTGQQP